LDNLSSIHGIAKRWWSLPEIPVLLGGGVVIGKTEHPQPRTTPLPRNECGTVITQLHGVADNNRTARCLTCLAKRPEATFGQRLKAHRLAAGLTLTALERRSGVDLSLISAYECDRSQPKWHTLAKLIRVLGVKWLAVK
jgi:hypothetical protein